MNIPIYVIRLTLFSIDSAYDSKLRYILFPLLLYLLFAICFDAPLYIVVVNYEYS